MSEGGRGARGEWLDPDAYRRDFRSRRQQLRHADCWTFQRRQDVEDSPGRAAVGRGDWEAALALIEQQRPEVLRAVEEDRDRGRVLRCVRVVDSPITPHLRWQLRLLRMWAECGLGSRVVEASSLAGLEWHAPLPDVVVLGDSVLYEVARGDGDALGAVRVTDPGVVRNWAEFLRQLHAVGEDVIPYVDRHVLPPPRVC